MGIWYMTQGTQTGPKGYDRKGDGREVWEGGDMGVPMSDSCLCMTENHKIL